MNSENGETVARNLIIMHFDDPSTFASFQLDNHDNSQAADLFVENDDKSAFFKKIANFINVCCRLDELQDFHFEWAKEAFQIFNLSLIRRTEQKTTLS